MNTDTTWLAFRINMYVLDLHKQNDLSNKLLYLLWYLMIVHLLDRVIPEQ